MLILYVLFVFLIALKMFGTTFINIDSDESGTDDCVLSEWRVDGDCSASCGDGFQRLKRFTVRNPDKCASQPLIRYVPCKNDDCKTDCVGYFRDEDWSPCTVECGGGTQYRNFYQLKSPSKTGKSCPYAEIRACNTEPCVDPCDGEWTPWSECTKDCDTGTQTRTFHTTAVDADPLVKCPTLQTRLCNEQECPRHCEGYYDSWTPCSAECDGGIQSQHFVVEQEPNAFGNPCPGQRNRACNTSAC